MNTNQNNLIKVEDLEKGQRVEVKWLDSYGVQSGWQDISSYSAEKLEITSWGVVIFMDDDIISLAHNFSEATENTLQQANGIMAIPKACITSVSTFSSSSCQQPVSKQKLRQP